MAVLLPLRALSLSSLEDHDMSQDFNVAPSISIQAMALAPSAANQHEHPPSSAGDEVCDVCLS